MVLFVIFIYLLVEGGKGRWKHTNATFEICLCAGAKVGPEGGF